jgi:hypothetical protein
MKKHTISIQIDEQTARKLTIVVFDKKTTKKQFINDAIKSAVDAVYLKGL